MDVRDRQAAQPRDIRKFPEPLAALFARPLRQFRKKLVQGFLCAARAGIFAQQRQLLVRRPVQQRLRRRFLGLLSKSAALAQQPQQPQYGQFA